MAIPSAEAFITQLSCGCSLDTLVLMSQLEVLKWADLHSQIFVGQPDVAWEADSKLEISMCREEPVRISEMCTNGYWRGGGLAMVPSLSEARTLF